MSKNDVATAFELLLEEIKNAQLNLMKQLKRLVDSENFEDIQNLSERAKKMKDFQKKVHALKKEWNKIFARNKSYSISIKKKEN